MPTYEYQCPSCGKHFEIVQKMSDDAITSCPECKKPGLQKLISGGSFQLKGAGWYVTDYSKTKSSTENKSTDSKTVTETKDSTDSKDKVSGTAATGTYE
ncbi:zinc ribbon domain-containing protein [soil metagenome]